VATEMGTWVAGNRRLRAADEPVHRRILHFRCRPPAVHRRSRRAPKGLSMAWSAVRRRRGSRWPRTGCYWTGCGAAVTVG